MNRDVVKDSPQAAILAMQLRKILPHAYSIIQASYKNNHMTLQSGV